MDEYSSRKAVGELSFSRKASPRLSLRDSADNKERNSQVCSRAGCSSRLNVTKTNPIGSSGKAKTTRHNPFHLSTTGKEAVASSSRTLNDPRKPTSDPRKKSPCHQPADSSLSSEAAETPVQNNVSGEASSSASVNHSRHGKKTMKRPELGTDGATATKYDLRNLKCNSVNDMASSSSSSSSSIASDMNPDGKRVMNRKRISEKINGTLLDGRRSESSICISSSRRTRNSSLTMDNDTAPFLTQRSTDRRARLSSEQEDRNRIRQSETLPILPLPSIPVDPNTSSSDYQFPSSSRTNVFRRLGSNRANASSNFSLAPFDVSFGSSFTIRENVSQYSLDGIAEMLLALGRVDQDEERTHERLLLLETNLFLSGLSFTDQHRDMRLDIDNMSYEELLALGERIGTVSTALTEEALEKSIKKSFYHATASRVVGEDDDGGDDHENKCSICQEEYEEGNEMGMLGCEHEYHLECIEQWLHLKNWCPFCKADAAPPSPS